MKSEPRPRLSLVSSSLSLRDDDHPMHGCMVDFWKLAYLGQLRVVLLSMLHRIDVSARDEKSCR